MSGVIEQPRHLCMLSAKQSVVAIERAVPIVHAGPGCSGKLWSGLSFCNGFQGSGYAGGGAVPSTNTGEKEVVFGGEERLRSVIEGALKVMDADLFVVLTGCTSDIVGDDTGQVVREFREQGIPIVYAETGGFKGSSFVGHEALLEAVITQLLDPAPPEKAPNLVNVFASVPYLDPFWSGNLEALRELLAGLGLEANILFGPGSGGIEAWRKIPPPASIWWYPPGWGLKRHGFWKSVTALLSSIIRCSPSAGRKRAVSWPRSASSPALTGKRQRPSSGKEEARFYYYLERAADFILEFRYDLPGRFVTVCDSLYALAVSRFLVNDLGLLPGRQFITDQTPTEHRESLQAEFAALSPSVAAQVTFTPDGGEVQRELRATKHHQPPLIIGSTWDKDIAAELKGYQVSLSLPVTDRLVLDRSYVGYRGGLRLAEDFYTAILGSYQ
jgi:nitrogenase molybdenum-iron protein beta chain